MAPEALDPITPTFTTKSDVWGYGVRGPAG